MTSNTITTKLKELPAELERELLDYMDFLIQKYGSSKKSHAFRFDWENGLSDLKKEYTSVELQHKAMGSR